MIGLGSWSIHCLLLGERGDCGLVVDCDASLRRQKGSRLVKEHKQKSSRENMNDSWAILGVVPRKQSWCRRAVGNWLKRRTGGHRCHALKARAPQSVMCLRITCRG